MLDIKISNATVIDGSGKERFRADVGVRDGVISSVGNVPEQAARTIDAAGLVLAPGFIDSHSHADNTLYGDTSIRSKIEQGVTTSISGHCGHSMAPIMEQDRLYRDPGDGPKLPVSDPAYESFPLFVEKLRTLPLGGNMGMFLGLGSVRDRVMGYSKRPPDKAELSQMRKMVEEAMEAGAYGVSLGLFYAPNSYADTEEEIDLVSVAVRHGGMFAIHMRDEGYRLEQGLDEAIAIAERTGARCVISHHKAMLPANWGKTKYTLEKIDAAIARGVDLYMDMYPYTAASAGLDQALAPVLRVYDKAALLEMMGSPSGREEIREAILKNNGLLLAPGENYGDGFSRTMIVGSRTMKEYEGLTITELADQKGVDCFDVFFEVLREDQMTTRIAFFCMDEEDLVRVFRHPRCMICSDSGSRVISEGNHPRVSGTFPRFLGRYIREQKILTLEEGIRKMTSLPARVHGLERRGLILPGYAADLTLFDPETILDHAYYTDCYAPNDGIENVILDGRIVLEHGKMLEGAMYGRYLDRNRMWGGDL